MAGGHGATVRVHSVPFHPDHPRFLIDRHLIRQSLYEFQGMELCLVIKPNRAHGFKWESGLPGEAGPDAQRGCSAGLAFQVRLPGRLPGIEIGRQPLKMTGDLLLADERFKCFHRGFARGGVQAGPFFSGGPNQLLVEQTVLAGDFGRGVFGLASGNPVRLQHDHGDSPAAQKKGGEYPRHTRPDDGGIRCHIAGQRPARGNLRGSAPDGLPVQVLIVHAFSFPFRSRGPGIPSERLVNGRPQVWF